MLWKDSREVMRQCIAEVKTYQVSDIDAMLIFKVFEKFTNQKPC